MTAVSGTRRAMKELVDGTIRVQIDIDPIYRRQFLQLFPNIDMPIALAPLMVEQPPEPKPAFQTVAHSARAAMLCKDPQFHEFLDEHFSVEGEEDAAVAFLRSHLGIKTRAELDTSPETATKFMDTIVKPFESWRKWDER